ncbi:MAG: YhdT family protein [Spirochaetaceae bacterium]|nr:YhdT family protein [Spirochaetaceae bacterium]
MDYKKKHALMRREARATLIAAVLVMIFWWAAGFGLARTSFTIFYLPGWFVVSCFGSWLFSVILVLFLIKRVFTDFSLEDEDEAAQGIPRPAEGENAASLREEKPRGGGTL